MYQTFLRQLRWRPALPPLERPVPPFMVCYSVYGEGTTGEWGRGGGGEGSFGISPRIAKADNVLRWTIFTFVKRPKMTNPSEREMR